jgi:hypothetical protein
MAGGRKKTEVGKFATSEATDGRETAMAWMERLAPAVIELILKILLFPDSPACDLWRDDLARIAGRLGRLNVGADGRENYGEEEVLEILYHDRLTRLPLDLVDECERDFGAARPLSLRSLKDEVRAFHAAIRKKSESS